MCKGPARRCRKTLVWLEYSTRGRRGMKPEAMIMCAHDIILACWAYHTNTTDLGAETTEIFFSWFWSLEV